MDLNQESNSKSSKKIVTIMIVLLLVLTLIAGIYIIFFSKNRININNDTQTTDNTEESQYQGSSENTENQFSEGNDNDQGEIEHNLKLTIISPEEEYFAKSQARMYNALVEGNGKYATTIKCIWRFYIDENNGEYLYKEQEIPGVLAGESKEICGFTTTMIDKRGKLRVELTMTVYNAVNENLETVVADRKYVVN